MTVLNELQRIENNIKASYTALADKGAELPTKQNSDNLATTIANLEVGGGGNDEVLKSIIEGTATEIVLPDNVEKITSSLFRNASGYPFYNTNIKSIKANGVIEINAYGVAGQLKELETIEMPNVKKIGNYAFHSTLNGKIKKVVFGSLEEIGNYALYGVFNVDEAIEANFGFNNCVVGDYAFVNYNQPSFDASGIKTLGKRVFNYKQKKFKKIWLPSTIETIDASSSSNSLFYAGESGNYLTIYTDIPDESNVPNGWGSYWNHGGGNYLKPTTVYGATYEDFLNAEV